MSGPHLIRAWGRGRWCARVVWCAHVVWWEMVCTCGVAGRREGPNVDMLSDALGS